jgi:hypothetical protein
MGVRTQLKIISNVWVLVKEGILFKGEGGERSLIARLIDAVVLAPLSKVKARM